MPRHEGDNGGTTVSEETMPIDQAGDSWHADENPVVEQRSTHPVRKFLIAFGAGAIAVGIPAGILLRNTANDRDDAREATAEAVVELHTTRQELAASLLAQKLGITQMVEVTTEGGITFGIFSQDRANPDACIKGIRAYPNNFVFKATDEFAEESAAQSHEVPIPFINAPVTDAASAQIVLDKAC